jgi:L-amino acid N-acyltransferase YncA
MLPDRYLSPILARLQPKAPTMIIRPLASADLCAVAALWNEVIRASAITFTTEEKTLPALVDWLAAGPPRIAAEGPDGALLGFVAAGPFRGGPGYARTWEHSIFVTEPAKGRGIGAALMDAMQGAARAQGIGSLIGGISGANVAAQAFHARLGFVEVGRIPRAGWKFDRWLDLVLMQRLL